MTCAWRHSLFLRLQSRSGLLNGWMRFWPNVGRCNDRSAVRELLNIRNPSKPLEVTLVEPHETPERIWTTFTLSNVKNDIM